MNDEQPISCSSSEGQIHFCSTSWHANMSFILNGPIYSFLRLDFHTNSKYGSLNFPKMEGVVYKLTNTRLKSHFEIESNSTTTESTSSQLILLQRVCNHRILTNLMGFGFFVCERCEFGDHKDMQGQCP